MSLHDVYQVLIYSSLLSTTVPLLLLTTKRGTGRLWKILKLYLIIALLFDLASFVLVKGFHKGNFNLIYVFNFLEAFLIGWFFQNLFQIKWKLLFSIIGLALVEILLSIVFPLDFNSIFAVITSTLFLALCIYYFYRLMDDLTIPSLLDFPMFWVISGISFYFGISLFVTASEHFIRNSNAVAGRFVWGAQLIANIVFHLLLAIGVWKIRFEPQHS